MSGRERERGGRRRRFASGSGGGDGTGGSVTVAYVCDRLNKVILRGWKAQCSGYGMELYIAGCGVPV